ncbi:hypothetical protein JQN72_09655 [Phycicoccus sp. CSK15P-2]|uniref:hypothetical protein n=1 Tax=Phycicoccus sp. CSK15P-2 TaxID=2807627 RepID=UPI00194E234B|nr:hypothetical protein [Phycicoccus sp. CSK15P-2]MBM6404505.1 hypothetical protein [Phycicoccus sp. CSK15P-2]
MDVAQQLHRLGGVARRHEIEEVTGRRALEEAVASGAVVRVARGRYALPLADAARDAALQLTGTAILLSAASAWGWPTKWPAARPQVAVPPGRTVEPAVREKYDVRWRAVPHDQRVDGWLASRVRTVHDCCALLPFDEALCVVDAALAEGRVSPRMLADVAHLPPRVRAKVLPVVEQGTQRSGGPFETVVRAVALDVAGLGLRPQVTIRDADGVVGRVDLADERLRIVVEADSSEFHAGRADFARDCERYSRLTVAGWLVVRVPWVVAMHHPERLRQWLERAVALRLDGRPG